MFSIIFGVVTAIGASVLVAFLNQLWKINIQGFSILIILPVGAAVLGFVAASGLLIGNRIFKEKINKRVVLIAILLGLVSFFGSIFAEYHFAKSKAKETFTAQMKEYYGDLSGENKKKMDELFEKEFNFGQYFNTIYSQSKISITSRRGKTVDFDSPIFSIISFWANLIGVGIGGYFLSNVLIGERRKSRITGNYQDLKFSKNFAESDFDELKQAISSENIAENIIDFIKKKNDDESVKPKISHAVLLIMKDRESGVGEILAQNKEVSAVGNSRSVNVVEQLSSDIDAEKMEKILDVLKEIDAKEKF